MIYAIIIILIALLQYMFFAGRVGANRGKFEITAPHVAGNETWERMFRVQMNTLEQIIIFIPGMLAFSYYVNSNWVILPGVVYIIGRQIYSAMYISNPEKRGFGMILTFIANFSLVIGALIGAIITLI